MLVTNNQLWPEIEQVLNLPKGLPVVGFNLNMKAAHDIPLVTIELVPTKEHAIGLFNIFKNYDMVERA